MKKIIILLLSLVMVLSLAACGGDKDSSTNQKTQPGSNNVISGDESPSGEGAASCGEPSTFKP